MAEQLLMVGAIDEEMLKCMPLPQAQENIGIALLANSSL